LRFRVSGLGFGFRKFKVSGLKVSGFGFRVYGFGFKTGRRLRLRLKV
jgi:hypothetical protein